MTKSPSIEAHLEELRQRLGRLFWLLPFRKKRLLAEAESHLLDCARHLEAEGLGEAEAVRRFGDSRDLVRQWARAEIRSTLAPLLALVTLATVATGVLTFVAAAPSLAFPGDWIRLAIALFRHRSGRVDGRLALPQTRHRANCVPRQLRSPGCRPSSHHTWMDRPGT